MKHLEGMLKLVENELGAIESNGKFRSREEIDSVYKLIDIAKDCYCIWEYEDGMDDGYSERYPYRGGMSYGRGRGVKRDSMGRYSRDDGMGYRDRGYSRDDGNREYIEELKEMMRNAPNEETRQSIQRMISQMDMH